MTDKVVILAGVPVHNPWLFRRTPFVSGDPMAFIETPNEGTFAIIRDIEIERFTAGKMVDHVHCPKDFEPAGGLSGDRETATAQAAAEFFVRKGVNEVWTDRSLPMLFAHLLSERGITVQCDPDMGVMDRRSKSAEEVEHLRAAQQLTEQAVRFACELIAGAQAGQGGVLSRDGETLSSQSVQAEINVWLLRHGMDTCDTIVAGGAQGAECHERGVGPLHTGEPVIIDIFPMHPASRYFGDCTRTVVHGEIPSAVAKMHAVVARAKQASVAATRAGVTGETVHRASCDVFTTAGYSIGLPGENDPDSYTGYVHGTGHGVGIEVHEPPLLDVGGPELVVGDCLTIEPGLYSRAVGGVRIEDMVIVTEAGCDNLNSIPEGLSWA